jgi:hypothetical protein
MGDVVGLPVITTVDLPPGKVLQGALETHLHNPFKRVLVIAVHENGDEFQAASDSDGAVMLWDMERVRHTLMKIADGQ